MSDGSTVATTARDDDAVNRTLRASTASGSRRIYSLFTPYLSDESNEAWRSYLFLHPN